MFTKRFFYSLGLALTAGTLAVVGWGILGFLISYLFDFSVSDGEEITLAMRAGVGVLFIGLVSGMIKVMEVMEFNFRFFWKELKEDVDF